jgi:hypothetical protein
MFYGKNQMFDLKKINKKVTVLTMKIDVKYMTVHFYLRDFDRIKERNLFSFTFHACYNNFHGLFFCIPFNRIE